MADLIFTVLYGFVQEHGATRLFEAMKVYQDAEKAKEAQEEEDKKDPMKMLEKRTMMSRAEMEAMGRSQWLHWSSALLDYMQGRLVFLGNLEDLQEISRHKEAIDVVDYLQSTKPVLPIVEQVRLQEQEDEEFIR